jgi:hypothetical protein
MKKFRYLVVAIDDWGGSIKHEVRAISEQEAEDLFKFMHAAENFEIVEIKYLGL